MPQVLGHVDSLHLIVTAFALSAILSSMRLRMGQIRIQTRYAGLRSGRPDLTSLPTLVEVWI